MRVSFEAKGQLTELVKRAEAGDEVILTRRGRQIVRVVAVAGSPGLKGRRALMEKARAMKKSTCSVNEGVDADTDNNSLCFFMLIRSFVGAE